jgi:hypothetical protein
MSEKTQIPQGGFVQDVALPVVGDCCGTAGASTTAGCCGEPVATSVPSSSGPAAVGCCGEPGAPQEKWAASSPSCCG